MIAIERLQAYLRETARRHYAAVAIPPFTLFFHPRSDEVFFNYAIPDEPAGGDLRQPLEKLRQAFAARERRPRFEFIEEFAPDLASALQAAGFAEEARQQLMLCPRGSLELPSPTPGLQITTLRRESPLSEAQTFLATQRQGFEPSDMRPVPPNEAAHFLRELGEGRAFLARLGGQPIGAGLYTEPLDRLAELAGLATLEPYRRRGVATALTALAVQTAFDQGVETVCLTAEDARAGRVYERVGFRPVTTMLAYSEPAPNSQ